MGDRGCFYGHLGCTEYVVVGFIYGIGVGGDGDWQLALSV